MTQLLFVVSFTVLLYIFFVLWNREYELQFTSEKIYFAMVSSVIVCSGLACILAVAGCYNLIILSISLFIVSAGASFYLFKRQALLSIKQSIELVKGISFCKSVAVILVCCAVLYMGFPTVYLNSGRDPGVYAVEAMHISSSGGLKIESDSFIEENFAVVEDSLQVGYPGFHSEHQSDQSKGLGDVIYQFLPLFPSILAIGYDLAGIPGLIRINSIIALLALLSIYFFAKRFFNKSTAVIVTLFMALNPSQLWNARITQTELLSQMLFFLGVYTFGIAWEKMDFKTSCLAGVLLGIGCFNRIDTYILGLGISCVIIYVALWKHKHIKIILGTATIYFSLTVASVVYGFTRAYPYYHDLWRSGSLSGIITLNAVFFGVAAVGIIVRLCFLREREIRNLPLRILDSKGGSLALVLVVTMLFLYAYFIRPMSIDPTAWNKGNWDTESFAAHAMVEFCWYTSFLAIPLALFGLFKAFSKSYNYREEIFLFLGIGLASMIGYILNPSITPDHIWASRRWITINIPAVMLLCAFGISSIRFEKLRYAKRINTAVRCIGLTMISLYLAYQCIPFAFVQMLKGYDAQLESVVNKLNSNENQAIYFSNDGEIAGSLRYAFNKPVYLVKNYRNIRDVVATIKQECFYIGGRPLEIFGIKSDLQSTNSVGGLFLSRSRGSYPRDTFVWERPLNVYKLSLMDEKRTIFSLNEYSQFYSENKKLSSGWVSNGDAGALIYGPYITLDRSNYEFTADLKLLDTATESIGHADIFDGKNQLYKTEIHKSDFADNNSFTLEMPASIARTTQNIEFRIYLNEGVVIELEGATLEKSDYSYVKILPFNVEHIQNGTLENDKVQSNGQAGTLVYGPGMFLDVGFYQADVDMRLETSEELRGQIGTIDVADAGQVIAAKPFFAEDFTNGDLTVTLPFILGKNVEVFELRVNVDDSIPLCVEERRLSGIERYPVLLSNMQSSVGLFNGEKIVSTDSEGYLAWGNYMTIYSGNYQVEVLMEEEKPLKSSDRITVDVVCKQGFETLSTFELKGTDFTDGKASVVLPIALKEAVDDFEVRVFKSADCQISVTGIELAFAEDQGGATK